MEKKKEYTPIEAFLAEGGASKRIVATEKGLGYVDDDKVTKRLIGVDEHAWNVRTQ